MFYLEEKSEIKYYKSTVLDNDNLIHAFTTRINGKDNDFRLGTAGKKELEEQVAYNRKKICDVLELNYNLIINPKQEHTDNIKIVTGIDDDISQTDGVITEVPGLVLVLLFADCTPVIMYAPKEKVIGVIHAGWRGTAKSIVKKAANIFHENFKVDLKSMKVAIGPAIGQCCYPVSREVALELQKSVDKDYDNLFKYENTGEIKVDLKRLNACQLTEMGIKDIDILDDCTKCKNSLFYSYRAEKEKTGRHSAIASLAVRP